MTSSRIRSTGPLGTVVVLAFLAALVSGPLRPCLSHEGHAHDAFSHSPVEQRTPGEAVHASHLPHDGPMASDTPADGAQGGCECVGLCQLETSPFLPLGDTRTQIQLPAPTSASDLGVGTMPVGSAAPAVSLARAPPPVA